MKTFDNNEIHNIEMALSAYPASFINGHQQELSILGAAQNDFENHVSKYMDALAQLDFFNHVRQINCLSNHTGNMTLAINDLINSCKNDEHELRFAKDLDSYIAEYISNWTMYVVSDAWHDNRLQSGEPQTVLEQYNRIVETATNLNRRMLERDINAEARLLVQSNLDEIRSGRPANSNTDSKPTPTPVLPTAKAETKSKRGWAWGIIFLIIIIIRIVLHLTN